MKTSELKAALELVRPGLATKEILEQATNFILKDKYVWTFNDEVSVLAPLDIAATGAVPAEPLYKLLAKLPADGDLDIKATSNELRIKCGNSSTGIVIDPDIRLPLDEELVPPKRWRSLQKEFMPALKAVLFSASRSPHLPVMTCVQITSDSMQTCDEYRMTRCGGFTMQMDGGHTDLKIVAKHLERLHMYKPFKYGFSGQWMHFRNEAGVSYVVRLVDAEYPDLEGFLNVEGPVIEFPAELKKSLEWASIMADDKNIYEQEVEIHLARGKLTVRGEGPKGWAEDSIRMRYTGEPAVFKANPTFLKEMAERSRKITISSEALKVEGDDGFVHIVALDNKDE